MADTAAAVAVKFPAAHAPDVARKLLLTAATRGHAAALQTLASCALVQQHPDAGTVGKVLQQLIHGEIRCLETICKLPAAQQLGCSVVEQLLLAAIEHSNNVSSDRCMEALCGLPAASQLGSNSVTRLLLAAVEQNSRGGVAWLCRLPGLQQADSAALKTLIEAALLDESFIVPAFLLHYLLRLPAAAQLSIDAVDRLLNAALACKYPDCMRLLLAHPMATQLSSDMVA
jgi:hypothetical protein